MHGSSISKGNENRDQSNLNSYIDWLAEQIHDFINKNIEENVEFSNTVSSEEPDNPYSRSLFNLYYDDRYG